MFKIRRSKNPTLYEMGYCDGWESRIVFIPHSDDYSIGYEDGLGDMRDVLDMYGDELADISSLSIQRQLELSLIVQKDLHTT